MTTVEQTSYRGMEKLLGRLEQVRFRLWLFRIITGGTIIVTIICGALFLASLAGYIPGQPPAFLRWALFLSFAALVIISISIFGVRRILRKFNLAQTARHIESEMPEIRNDQVCGGGGGSMP